MSAGSAALAGTAAALVAPGRGILAADESNATIRRRFEPIGLESTPETRRAYREMLFGTRDIERYISGVILYDETIRESTSRGTPFPELLSGKGILPGIKVDRGTTPLAISPDETITEGLDGLRERLAEYRALGACFAKWRATYTIGAARPSGHALRVNAHALARYAALAQEAGLVPIVEPEVLMDGDHSIEAAGDATGRALEAVYRELNDQRVDVHGTLLKPNMVVSGYDVVRRAGVEEVAERTLECLYRHVPAAVPGIVFLSGGQTDQDATAHLNAMNRRGPHPWQLSFSYARALQGAALRAWRGIPHNVTEGRDAFYHRAKLNSAARGGGYSPEMERQRASL